MLALLVARRNSVVHLDRVVEELWPVRVPNSATANVRTYISTLRRFLGPERDRLTTQAESYLLELADDELDAARFDRQVSRARATLREGAVDEAVSCYREALGLWRGEPFQGTPTGPTLSPYVTALSAARTAAQEGLLEAKLHGGQVDKAVSGLRLLLADHPVRESAWCMLIWALHAAGDRSGALEAYRQARRNLAAMLGLDPGSELEAVQRDVLNGTRQPAPARSRHPQTMRMVARQLPLAPAVLEGRATELEQVRAALANVDGERAPHSGPAIVALHGIGGVGKSSLAVTAAHQVAADYPDGQLYVDLQASAPGTQPLKPAEALGRFLRALGIAEQQVSHDVDEAAGWFRSHTADRRILVVLDNAVDVEQVRPLLPTSTDSGVLITSRRPLSTLDGALRLRLREMSEDAAVKVLHQLVGLEHMDAQAHEVVRLCGHLPMAIRIIGVRLVRNRESNLADAARRLRETGSRLDELSLAELDLRSTFDVGYRALLQNVETDQTAARAAQLFRRLGATAIADVTPTTAATLIHATEDEVRGLLITLVDHGLIEPGGAGYRLPDLLRLFAAELAASEEPADEVAAVSRLDVRALRPASRSQSPSSHSTKSATAR